MRNISRPPAIAASVYDARIRPPSCRNNDLNDLSYRRISNSRGMINRHRSVRLVPRDQNGVDEVAYVKIGLGLRAVAEHIEFERVGIELAQEVINRSVR